MPSLRNFMSRALRFLWRILPPPAFWGVAAIGLALAVFLFAWSGIYNVAASRGHWAIVEWALSFGMRNSVERRALLITPPALDRPGMALLGANHFEFGCAPCHGAPGKAPNPIAKSMLPSVPDLQGASDRWTDSELFWIIKNGVKYTSMPAWVAQQRDDEVWSLVSFLKALPKLDARQYGELVLDLSGVFMTSTRSRSETEQTALARCAGCHGSADFGPRTPLVPTLHGQPEEFLALSLRAYAAGNRHSGIMQPVASDLSETAIERLSVYYAGLNIPQKPSPVAIDPGALERGRMLAHEGATEAGIPACIACHGETALKTFPRLSAQSAAYMTTQLKLWKDGLQGASGPSTIMAPIAQRLSDQQIEDVVLYFSTQLQAGKQ